MEYLGIMEEQETEYYHSWSYYIYREGNKLIAGISTNTGCLPIIEIEYDTDMSLDWNLAELHDTIIDYEQQNKLTLDKIESCAYNYNCKEENN